MTLDLEALWNMAVKEAKVQANACYPHDCKEKRVYQERLISRYYGQRAYP